MYYTDKPNVFPQEKLKIPYKFYQFQKESFALYIKHILRLPCNLTVKQFMQSYFYNQSYPFAYQSAKYLHIDVAFVLFAIVEILKETLIIIEKCKKH